MPFTLGIDYETNSVRALVVDVASGRELGNCVVDYPSGDHGILLDPQDHHLARQHPGDYLLGLEQSVRAMKVIAADLPGGTSFMEDYTYHLAPDDHLVLGSHMLGICPSIAAGKPKVEVHLLGIGGKEDPVRLVFDATPGPALTRWTPSRRRTRCPSCRWRAWCGAAGLTQAERITPATATR